MAEKNGIGQLISQAGGRSVWQVLVLYMGASWGVLEGVDVLKDNMGLPDWVFPLAVVLLLIGLPIMLGTAVIQAKFAAQGLQAAGDDAPASSQDPVSATVAESAVEADDLEAHHIFTWRRALIGGAAAFVLRQRHPLSVLRADLRCAARDAQSLPDSFPDDRSSR